MDTSLYKRHAKIILGSVLGFLILVPSCFLLLWFCFRPLYVPAEYWIPEVFTVKAARAESQEGKKLIVLSGSNALFGVHSGILAEETGLQTLNLSVHAGLGIHYFGYLLRSFASAGDIVVMPVEYDLYYEKPLFSPWQLSNFSTWARPYLDQQNAYTQSLFMLKIMPGYMQRVVNWKKKIPVRSREDLDHIIQNNTQTFTDPNKIYSAEGLNRHAEFLIDAKTKDSFLETKGYSQYLLPLPIDQDSITYLIKLADEVGVTLYFSYPTSIKNTYFDLDRDEHRKKLEEFVKQIELLGGNFIGIDRCYNIDISYFYDTSYHLNAEGSILRSFLMADAINDALGTKKLLIPDLTVYREGQERKARQYLEKLREEHAVYEKERAIAPEATEK